MKITKVEVFRLPTANSKQNSPIGCRIHTDVGICGDGEAGMAYGVGGSGAFGMVCDLAELIIGIRCRLPGRHHPGAELPLGKGHCGRYAADLLLRRQPDGR